MRLTRETVPSLVSEVFGGRPTRWTPPERLIGDFDGRERTLDVFYASAHKQRALLRRLRPLRREIEETIGGPLLVIFHTPRETERLYPEIRHRHVEAREGLSKDTLRWLHLGPRLAVAETSLKEVEPDPSVADPPYPHEEAA